MECNRTLASHRPPLSPLPDRFSLLSVLLSLLSAPPSLSLPFPFADDARRHLSLRLSHFARLLSPPPTHPHTTDLLSLCPRALFLLRRDTRDRATPEVFRRYFKIRTPPPPRACISAAFISIYAALPRSKLAGGRGARRRKKKSSPADRGWKAPFS